MSTKITMSLVLASMLSMGITGCGSSSDDNSAAPVAAPTATDITVERGKVYDANVTDSSTPAQVAIEKANQNVYTFAKAPTYPVVVTGGWIDVNNDGKQGVEDVALDIQMKSYTTTVTPITTYVADANKTIREQKLEALVTELNANGVGEDASITVEDLLKVPSSAPADVMIAANAIYKDFKEKNSTTRTDNTEVLSQFSTIKGLDTGGDTSASAYEAAVMQNLINQNLIQTFTQAYIDSLTPAVVTPPTGGGDTTGDGDTTGGTTLPTLDGYSSIIIYKNIAQTTADELLNAYSANAGFDSSNVAASCTDFGFTSDDKSSEISAAGITTRTYSIINMTTYSTRTCTEADYTGAPVVGGSANILAYYGN